MKLIYIVCVFINILNVCKVTQGKTIFVSDYGAYSNDQIDDSIAIQLAINDIIEDDAVTIVNFGPGIYDINSTISISSKNNLIINGQGPNETQLIGHFEGTMFFIRDCQNITLTLFSIDFNPLPFTAGYIVNINDTYVDIEVVPPHQTDVDKQVRAILRYDPIQMRPAFGINTHEMYQNPSKDLNTSLVSPGILRLPLTSRTDFQKGDPVVVRYVLVNHAIYAIDTTDITIQSITIYTSWMMGFVTLRARRLNVIDYHLKPFDGRWMSSSADCMHLADSREYISIVNSSCESMGDDGLNVHGYFFNVTKVIDDRTIVLSTSGWDETLNVGIGTNLEFRIYQQPFTVHANGTIASITMIELGKRQVTFTDSVNTTVGDWVTVAGAPILTVRNFTVANNRARGLLLEVRNADIRQSIFNRTSGPAVLFQPSIHCYEGPEGRNITLAENLFIENNEGIAQQKGIITSLPETVQLVPVITDIRIESSTFFLGNYSQGLLQSNNVNNLTLQGNYISTNNATSLISICNSRNLTADNNCLVNNKVKIEQYYTFDETDPCSDNLTSLIHLPVSAFNSSCFL